MTQRIADEREHRRGLVLGLTLAEVLLLLLFLLLLALGARLQRLAAEITSANTENERLHSAVAILGPQLDKLRTSGQLDGEKFQSLIERIARLGQLEKLLRERDQRIALLESQLTGLKVLGTDTDKKLAEVNDLLLGAARINPADPLEALRRSLAILEKIGVKSTLDEVPSASAMQTMKSVIGLGGSDNGERLNELRDIVQEANRIHPENPPEVLRQGLAALKALGADNNPKELSNISNLAEKITDLKTALTALQGERDRIKAERDNLMHGGKGLMYPSCWIGESGETEYMFEVSILDSGLIVIDSEPLYRKGDEAWKYVDAFPRAAEIPESRFQSATARLFAWSREHDCRFVVTMKDFTGPTSKERYKKLVRVVEQHFYVKRIDSPRGSPADLPIGGPLPTNLGIH